MRKDILQNRSYLAPIYRTVLHELLFITIKNIRIAVINQYNLEDIHTKYSVRLKGARPSSAIACDSSSNEENIGITLS